jgi:predicted CXXCH cytochrome family protein
VLPRSSADYKERDAARRRAAVALAIAASLLGACSGARAPGDAAGERGAEATFVGHAVCAECHPAEAASWRGSHHALAMLPASDSTVSGDFSGARFSAHGVTSTFSRQGGAFIVRTDGADGSLATFPIAYTFGVAPLQQYLVTFGRGRLQALGLAWDSRPKAAGGGRWFHLYPHERMDHRDPLHWTGRDQTWNYQCAECHSTNLHKGYEAPADSYRTTWSEVDVACEACHGPGSRHVAWARAPGAHAGAAASAADAGLVIGFARAHDTAFAFAPGAATAHRVAPRDTVQVEACARCHSRRGWVWEEVRAGGRLAQTHRVALLDEGLYRDDGQIEGEVYEYGSFLQSRMYAQGVVCSDCHDPHAARLRATGNTLCQRCHSAAAFDTPEHHHHASGSPGAQCVECHMPSRTYMVVDPRRDHSLRVPRPDLSVSLGTPNACNDCHRDRTPKWAADATVRWFPAGRTGRFHFGEALHAARAGKVEAAELLRRVVEDPEQPAIVRATATGLLSTVLTPALVPLVEKAARDPEPLVRRAAAGTLDALDSRTRARVGAPLIGDSIRTVRLEAAPAMAGLPPGLLTPEQSNALDRAIAEYRASQAFNADRPESHLNLGNLDRRSGRPAEAEADYRRAIALDSTFVPARVNLADVLASRGDEAACERELRSALVLEPGNADVHHALGLSLVRQHRTPEALAELRRAAEGASNARYAFVYGVALHDAGRVSEALDVLARAQARHPADRDILGALVAYTTASGDQEAARRWSERMARLPG